MSHSQFHCTGRAYLDMHGLIFETSICYWQDQPGRGKRARRRGAGRAGGGGGKRREPGRRPAPPREVRKPGGRGGGSGRALAGPGDPTAPVPPAARMPDRATRPRVREGRGAPPPPRGRHEGEGRGGAAGGGGRRATLLSPSSTPPGPGHHDGDGRRAPSASVRPPTPERGGGGRAARTRRPARGGGRDRGPVPRSGERIGAGAPPRPARDDGGGGGGGDTGDGSGPRRAREARHTGAHGPGEQQTARGPRRTDGRTERGTDGMRPRGADTTQPVAEVGWPRATARGTAQSDPAEGTRVGRRGPPRDLTARGPPGTGAVPRHHPGRRRTGAPTLAGLAPTATATPRAAAGPGRTLSRRTPAAPAPTALTRAGLPAPPPSLRASEGTAPPGDATGPAEAGGRHPREARRGRLGPRQGTGTRAVARAGRGRGRGRRRRGGAGKHARRGPRDRDAGAAPRTRRQRPGTRPGPQEHQRGIPPPPAREGGPATPGAPAGPGHPRSVAHDPAPPPRPASRPPVFRHPSATDPSFHLRLNPEARHPGDDALERGGPDRDRTPPPAAAQAARAGATGPSSPPAGGAGEAEADRASRPDTAPLPPGLTPRGPAARTRPPTCRTPGGAQRDPPPTRRGEARAAVGNERHTAPPRGRRTQLPPLPRRAGEFCSAHVLWQSPRWPLRTREGQRLGAPVPQGSLSDR